MPKKMKKKSVFVPASDLPLIKEPNDFRASFHWRVFRILAEFVDGWNFLADIKKSVSIFGSARFAPGNKWYEEAKKTGAALAKAGYGVVTGGGPGIMEGGNHGAYEAGGESVGLNISLPFEQRENEYLTKSIGFHYFFIRKVMLSYSASAYIYFPGGFGTLDELFELVTLVQTKKVSVSMPIILYGKKFWTPLMQWIESSMVDEYKTVSHGDLKIFQIVDSPEEVIKAVRKVQPRKEFYY
ncbi:MAG: TIGR00730 family Rossman fold protein [bacterium]